MMTRTPMRTRVLTAILVVALVLGVFATVVLTTTSPR